MDTIIPMELARYALSAEQSSTYVRALRAWAIICKASVRRGIPHERSAVMTMYEQVGLTARVCAEDLVALAEPWVYLQERTTALAEVTPTHVTVRGIKAIWKELAINASNRGFRIETDESFATLPVFKAVLFTHVSFTLGRDTEGGVTVSRAHLEKSTGVSRSTQRRYERRQGIRVRPNTATVPGADATSLNDQYGPRRRGDRIQIRNTYYAPFAGRSGPTRYTPEQLRHRIDARNATMHPDGLRSLPQTFQFFPDREILEPILRASCAVDIYVREYPHPRTGELFGDFIHIEPNALDVYEEAQTLYQCGLRPSKKQRYTPIEASSQLDDEVFWRAGMGTTNFDTRS